jgi:hypothetical protein
MPSCQKRKANRSASRSTESTGVERRGLPFRWSTTSAALIKSQPAIVRSGSAASAVQGITADCHAELCSRQAKLCGALLPERTVCHADDARGTVEPAFVMPRPGAAAPQAVHATQERVSGSAGRRVRLRCFPYQPTPGATVPGQSNNLIVPPSPPYRLHPSRPLAAPAGRTRCARSQGSF